jgi:predicted RNA-binding Zn ribbon-like protein
MVDRGSIDRYAACVDQRPEGSVARTVSRPDLDHVLETITVLVNSGPPSVADEGLCDVAALRRFVQERVITEIEQPGEKDLEEVREARALFRTVFVAPNQAVRADIVNRIMAGATITPRLTEHDGLGLHLHFSPVFSRVTAHLLADCSTALAILLAAGNGGRLRVCSAPDCSRVFVDGSRNQSRAFCDSGKCANRVNAAAYRQRQRLQQYS